MHDRFASSAITRSVALAVAGLWLAGIAQARWRHPPPAAAPLSIAPSNQPTDLGNTSTAPATESSAGFISGIMHQDTLLGDVGGARSFLSKYGLSISISETSEYLANVTGGIKRGGDYDGLTTMVLQLDTEHAFNWQGGTFNVSGLQIHGRNESADYLANLQTASGIESDRSTRLWELWYDQQLFNSDRIDIKIGQQSLDSEFMVSQNALLFVNTMFGWPMVPSADLPGGGPAYPLSALGARIRVQPTDSLTFLAGLYNGSPVSSNNGDPQLLNPSGTSFPLDGGVLAIAEVQYASPGLGAMVYANQPQPLSCVYKLGMWYDSESFNDQERDNGGLSLANPNSSGVPATHHGDFGIYGTMDQTVWQDQNDADRSVAVFARAMGTPQEDRNLIDFSLNLGLNFHDPLPNRDDDTFGIGMGLAKVSNRAAALDRDTGALSGTDYPVRGVETFVELTYQYQVTPWWIIQPDFQYVFNPGGGELNPDSPNQRVHDEAILGVRMIINF